MHHSHRLKKDKEFQLVFQNGSSTANRQFVVYLLKKEGQTSFRVGISVSKKIGNAVVRNKVKRYVKEAIRSLEDQIKEGYDFVIIARQGLDALSFDSIRSSLIHVLKRAKLLHTIQFHINKKG